MIVHAEPNQRDTEHEIAVKVERTESFTGLELAELRRSILGRQSTQVHDVHADRTGRPNDLDWRPFGRFERRS
jgi:hypothetical protein